MTNSVMSNSLLWRQTAQGIPNWSFIHVILHTHYPFTLLHLPTHSLFSIILSREAISWLSHLFLTLPLLNNNEKVTEGIISTVFLRPSDTSSQYHWTLQWYIIGYGLFRFQDNSWKYHYLISRMLGWTRKFKPVWSPESQNLTCL